MTTEIITIEDLRVFKEDLLKELGKILKEHTDNTSKKWLKSYEVKKLLGISSGTLQNMRINGTLPYTKIGGIIYYDHQDIQEMLENRKQNNKMLGQVFDR